MRKTEWVLEGERPVRGKYKVMLHGADGGVRRGAWLREEEFNKKWNALKLKPKRKSDVKVVTTESVDAEEPIESFTLRYP